MLSRIVTGDETWVSHITPESKQQSMEWRDTSYPIKVRAKQTLSKCKIMATVFWWCFAGGRYATRNNHQLRCLLRNSTEAPKSIAKQTVRHAVKRCFAPPR
ncbi:uncharacterized protein TNCV_3618061 [Trichonephila clavipes]|nr:uncharacterized protein TNCV_3618061 [Trichonephila clavipes]